MTEREFSYWLCNIEGIGRVTAGRLLKRAGSAQAVYEMKEQELAGLLSAAQLKSFQRARKEKNVKQEYQMLLKRGIRFLPVLIRSILQGLRKFRMPLRVFTFGAGFRKRGRRAWQ